MSINPVQPPAESPFPELKGFRILLELGRSPKGTTYKARRLVEQDVVALKVFRPSLCDRKFVLELPKNAEASFLLEHRGLARSLGCVHEGGTLMLMTEYAAGEPASKFLKRERPMMLQKALRAALQCANALRYAASHKKCHGRLHPADIILGEDDARLVGIGLGERPEHAAWSVRDPYSFEPLIYTAPEAMPSHAVGDAAPAVIATDVYALGAMLFHLLTGTPPFKSSDEESLIHERKRLLGSVKWPAEMQSRLPENVLRLVERMLLPDPASRPSYDDLISTLAVELGAAEKKEARKELAALAAKDESGHRGGVRTSVLSENSTPAAPRVPAPAGTADVRQNSMLARLYTLILVGMTALAFIVVFGFTALIFIYAPLKRGSQTDARSAAVPTAPTQAAPVLVAQPPPRVPAPEPDVKKPEAPQTDARGDDYAMATHQLDYIQEMLSKGEIKHTPALLRLVRGIAEKAGRDTPIGVKSLVLAAEIEETILRLTGEKPAPPKPVFTPPPHANETTLAPSAPHLPEATVDIPKSIPGVGPTGAAPEKYVEAPATPNVTPPTPVEKPMTTPPPKKVQPSKMAPALKAAAACAKLLQYPAQNIEIEKMLTDALGDDKKLAEAFWNAARLEQDLVKRCRARLLEQIQRHPRKESPLQVFPRKNDPNGDDIIDFDEAGLKIVTKKGPASFTRIQPWDKVPPLQAYMLLQLLADRANADDCLGLAVFATSRALKNEAEDSIAAAAAIPEGKDRAAAMREYFKALAAILDSAK